MILVDPDPANCRDPTGLDTQPCFERKAPKVRMFAKMADERHRLFI